MAGTIDVAGAKLEPAEVRQRIIEALMTLAGEVRWEEITIGDVATRAGVSLADFRDQFPSKGAVLAAFSRMIDRKVLEAGGDDLATETARDRLFDVLMRRIDAMAPYRASLKGISQWIRRDPVSAVAINSMALNSMRFMLEAAHLDSEGLAGTIKLQGLVLAWGRVLDVWFEDAEPGLDRTMAALDRELSRGQMLIARLDDMTRLTAPLRSIAQAVLSGARAPRTRPRDRDIGADDVTPV